MGLPNRVRLFARRSGMDFHRWPLDDPSFLPFRAFTAESPDVIIDVGANLGQTGVQLRSFDYRGRIFSIEPLSEPFRELSRKASKDPLWEVLNVAVGDSPGQMLMNVAGNDGASSSFLEMTSNHRNAAPQANYVGQEVVEVSTLAEILRTIGRDWKRPALKVDVQGYEREVLSGCGSTISRLSAVRLELSLVPLYADSWSWLEAVEFMGRHGFQLAGLDPGFHDPTSGRLLQFDGVFLPER